MVQPSQNVQTNTAIPEIETKVKLNEDILAYIDLSVQKMREAAAEFNIAGAQPAAPQPQQQQQHHQPHHSFIPDAYGNYNDPQDMYRQQQYDRVIMTIN